MKIALGQINTTIGDFAGNVRKIVAYSERAAERGADIVLFPELALCGYPPMDLLEREDFLRANEAALADLRDRLPAGLAVVIGKIFAYGDDWAGNEKPPAHNALSGEGGRRRVQNACVVVQNGEIVFVQGKTLLPNYDVFDEARYFAPASERRLWNVAGRKVGILVCEDLWAEAEGLGQERGLLERSLEGELEYWRDYAVNPVRELVEAGADLLLVSSASPFYAGKLELRLRLAERVAQKYGLALVYANAVGGNDSLIFDGRSFAVGARGELLGMAAGFVEDLLLVNVGLASERASGGSGLSAGVPAEAGGALLAGRQAGLGLEPCAELAQALCLGLRDYVRKTGFERVHLGVSGGVDSALVLVLAVRALGAERVRAFMLPSPFSSEGSLSDSLVLCARLGVRVDCIPIEGIQRSFSEALAELFAGTDFGLAEENIQARVRGSLLMAWSNKFNSLLLSTGNKSELAVGYCTLYGDMSGALSVIGDLFKTDVYALCHYINKEKELIPQVILTKAPSAELRPNQRDDDSLPSYEILDRILKKHVLNERSNLSDVSPEITERVLQLVQRSEYKRFQAAPVLKLSPKSFGTGRRIPIARAAYELKKTTSTETDKGNEH